MKKLRHQPTLQILLAGASIPLFAPLLSASPISTAQFESPARIEAGGKPISISDPGYATPAWADLTGDGRKDLIVGQFAYGRVQIFEHNEDGSFAEGRWLMANEEIATVPDIW